MSGEQQKKTRCMIPGLVQTAAKGTLAEKNVKMWEFCKNRGGGWGGGVNPIATSRGTIPRLALVTD